MGYTTDFSGHVTVTPPLSKEEVDFLTKFSHTRRMDRKKGPYYVDNKGYGGQLQEDDIINYNSPPHGQPGLWCQWVPSDDGTSIGWDGNEKFYDSPTWMKYLIEHFIGSHPMARFVLPFLKPHTLNGEIIAQGEDMHDRWKLVVKNNKVTVKQLA